MFKVNNKDTRTMAPCPSVSIVNFELVIASWVVTLSTAASLYAAFAKVSLATNTAQFSMKKNSQQKYNQD